MKDHFEPNLNKQLNLQLNYKLPWGVVEIALVLQL
jgi:hypothetical protein